MELPAKRGLAANDERGPRPYARTMERGDRRPQGGSFRGLGPDLIAGCARGRSEFLYGGGPDVRHVQYERSASEELLCLQSLPRSARHATARKDAAVRGRPDRRPRRPEFREYPG